MWLLVNLPLETLTQSPESSKIYEGSLRLHDCKKQTFSEQLHLPGVEPTRNLSISNSLTVTIPGKDSKDEIN